MRILVTGNGKSGSWRIRGEQLGNAIDATVWPNAKLPDIRRHDLTVVVKRVSSDLLSALADRRWVLDFVDGWPQPHGNEWGRDQAVSWLCERIAHLRPTAIVFPTTRMLEDSGWEGPSLVLPHHAWPKYTRQPAAEAVTSVGYEGAPEYLGRWRKVLERECAARGWRFVVNGDLSDCQIGVALRDVGGYPAGAWKANTKLANLQALGIPAIISPEQSYREFGSEAQIEAIIPEHIGPALDTLAGKAIRDRLGAIAHEATPTLQSVALTYREWLWAVANT